MDTLSIKTYLLSTLCNKTLFFFINSLSLFMATRIPFTESQWEELENQALVFKYLAANVPVPPHLLFLIRRPFLFSTSSSSSSPSTFFCPHSIGWNVYEMGMGRKVDAEPGRCRRTDGKKWRCSKEASPNSKYCERHMHRGKNRSSRKPPPPQFSVSSTPNLFLDSSLSSSRFSDTHTLLCFTLMAAQSLSLFSLM